MHRVSMLYHPPSEAVRVIMRQRIGYGRTTNEPEPKPHVIAVIANGRIAKRTVTGELMRRVLTECRCLIGFPDFAHRRTARRTGWAHRRVHRPSLARLPSESLRLSASGVRVGKDFHFAFPGFPPLDVNASRRSVA